MPIVDPRSTYPSRPFRVASSSRPPSVSEWRIRFASGAKAAFSPLSCGASRWMVSMDRHYVFLAVHFVFWTTQVTFPFGSRLPWAS